MQFDAMFNDILQAIVSYNIKIIVTNLVNFIGNRQGVKKDTLIIMLKTIYSAVDI